ncbi:3-phosphoshikimate 1-carboxyvinyltransferase [Oscillospiraceae bacterium MB08-C2-2]|nr:3-phosphoshikimate 1-carboxyvinyltransferase [Oscillospiraceae bacterium MB08-C2-2]
MDISITPSSLSGSVAAQPSKSAAHRAAICAMLAKGDSHIAPITSTRDMLATFNAALALGAKGTLTSSSLTLNGIKTPPAQAVLDCDESGSTLRFFIPIAAALGVTASFYGRGQLPTRPLEPLVSQLRSHGVTVEKKGDEILTISGRLTPGRYTIAGNISSQFITGLLFSLPLLAGDSEIILTTPLASKGYVDMTLSMLAQFGVVVETLPTGWRIPGHQTYRPRNSMVEGDFSGAAFWLCAGAIQTPVTVTGLSRDTAQGDRAVLSVLEKMGALVQWDGDAVTVSPGALSGIEIDGEDIPDLVPVLAVVACFAQGVTRFSNVGRLRIKECDRLDAMTQGLTALGTKVEQTEDSLTVTGGVPLGGGSVSSFDDHRIAMALSIAALRCASPVIIRSAQCVDKSYPDFYKDFEKLGGICHVI